MKVEIEHVSPIREKMTVALPPELVDREVDKAYLNLQKDIKLKGFRPGKAPLSLLQRYFKAQIEEDVISALVQESYPKALSETNSLPVSQPAIEKGLLEKGKGFNYTASFEIKPGIAVQGYRDLELEKEKLAVTDEDVEAQLKNLQNMHATLKTIEGRAAQKEDCVLLDYEGTIEGKPFVGSSVKDHLLEISTDSFLPGFTEHLMGLRAGDEKTFSIGVPDSHAREDLAGKTIQFKIRVKEIKEKVLPSLDDDFARDLGDYQNLDDLKVKIRESVKAEKEQRIEANLREKIMVILIERNPFEVPASLIERQIHTMILNTQQRLSAQGLKLEDFPNTIEKLSEMYKEPAEKQVRFALLLEAIAKKEGITIEDNDLESKYQDIASTIKQDMTTIKKSIDSGLLKAQILEEKAINFITSQATIKEN
ncbi:MAG: trigger factor [Proteobacteria bacterium]|nr:trigger factor [Pseudomonadota bacterium]